MSPVGPTGNRKEGKTMATQAERITVVQIESERLKQYLAALPADAWTTPSACALCAVRDVVAHLIMAAHLYTDSITRGLRDDTSPTAGRLERHAFTTASPAERQQRATAVAQRTIAFRESLGQELLDVFGKTGDHFNHLVASLSPHDMPRTLEPLLGHPIREVECSDDRLGGVLSRLSDDATWDAIERDLWTATVTVYERELAGMRLDSPTSYGYHRVVDEGVMQRGQSKDHRPDLPQLQLMAAAAAPAGHLIACDVHAGQCADDPLYTPLPSVGTGHRGTPRLAVRWGLPDGGAGHTG
jgi:Mycothiol maleylpyruvate isomerase N-terminal domain